MKSAVLSWTRFLRGNSDPFPDVCLDMALLHARTGNRHLIAGYPGEFIAGYPGKSEAFEPLLFSRLSLHSKFAPVGAFPPRFAWLNSNNNLHFFRFRIIYAKGIDSDGADLLL